MQTLTRNILAVLVAAFTLAALDFIWIGNIMKSAYITATGPVLHLAGGALVPNITATVLLYFVFTISILFWVTPRANTADGRPCYKRALFYGALFGFTLYAFYDLTNIAILSVWPWSIALVDILWGTFLGAVGSYVIKKILA